MSEDGCAPIIAIVFTAFLALMWGSHAQHVARVAEARRTICLERGGYYYEPGLIFRDETIYCMERPVPVDITPGRVPNREGKP